MKKVSIAKGQNLGMVLMICLIASAFGIYYYVLQPKWIALAAGAVMIALLTFSDCKKLKRASVLLVLAYVAIDGLTGFWAMSGKFFLREFSKFFIATAFFLAVVLWENFGKNTMQKLMAVLAGTGAVYAFLSMETATFGLSEKLITSLTGMGLGVTGFENGDRLMGILGNANISATIHALSIFFAVALLQNAEEKKERMLYSVILSLNAMVMLLGFSMGGIACFAVAIIVYLVFAGKKRGGAVVRMLEGAIPAMVWGFASFPFFNQSGMLKLLPLVFMVLNALSVIVLEEKVAPRLTALLEEKQKLVLIIVAAIVALAAVYVVAGYNLSGPYTFDGSRLNRSAYPEAGEHVLNIEADGEVDVTITSQTMAEVMMHKNTVLYKGPAENAAFTVPEGSEVCFFRFSAQMDTTISKAVLDGGAESIKLEYTLLPGFAANRLQGLWANQNAVQRTVFFEDGMKMFAQNPILGNGVGSFETGATSIQEFFYESRYIHNHYIQVLLESGVIGFAAFAGAMLSLLGLLWKRRKEEDELSWGRPALWATMVMLLAHAAVEVSLSIIIVQCYAFLAFGMIVASCPKKVVAIEEAVETAPEKPNKKAKQSKQVEKPKKSTSEYIIKGICIALPAVFVTTLGMNMVAKKMMNSPVSDVDDFLVRMQQVADLDPYEYNDAKLSMLYVTMDNPTPARLDAANRVAAELEQVQSNSLPQGLTNYYLATGQYEKAIRAANLATVYSATNPSSWNMVIGRLWDGFLGGEQEPLAGENKKELLQGLLDYYETLKEHNRTSMEPIELSTMSKQFFTEILALEQEPEKYGDIAGMLVFRLWPTCDADEDGVADQLVFLGDVEQGADGALTIAQNSGVEIEVAAGKVQALQVIVECENPEDIELTDIYTDTVQVPYKMEDGAVIYLALDTGNGVGVEGFRLTTKQAQAVTQIEISTNLSRL